MYKNQLQELAQRSCFNLPSYASIREGPDHAPRFKASVNFNGEIFEGPSYCSTLRQAEHAAAEVALNDLSTRGPSRSLTARVLDETGVYKNLLQETAHRAGLNLPVYTTVRSGPGHVPIFTCTVELAGMNFAGESAKTKKQAEKNAAIAAWSALKNMPNLDSLNQTSKEIDNREEQDQVIVARVLSNYGPKDETKPIRRRDQNQARRRMLRGHRDNAFLNCPKYHQWRLMNLLLDSSSEASTQKQNCFVSLLPPPPPRITSKNLATSSSRDSPSTYQSTSRPIPVQVMGKSQVKMKEVASSPNEHQKDEDDWINRKSEFIKELIEKEGPSKSTSGVVYRVNPVHRQFALPHNASVLDHVTQNEQSQIRSRVLGPPTRSRKAVSSIKAPACSHMSRTLYNTGGYLPERIAPAVQIRSVIPVCAAPPPPMRAPPSNPTSILKEAASASSAASMSTSTGAEFSSASPNFNKLQLPSTQLSSSFNKLQL